jgi:hypothetical protein
MAEQMKLRRFLFFEAMIARTPGTTRDLREVVDTVQAELVEQGWDEHVTHTWEQWRELLGNAD